KGGDYMAKDLLEVTSEIIIGNHESFYREFRAAKNEGKIKDATFAEYLGLEYKKLYQYVSNVNSID
ncbi:TPA: hypothetical protein ACJPS4_001759, partial [Streptococcus pyogenes]